MKHRKTLAALTVAALTAGGALLSSTESADAQWRGRGWGGGGMARGLAFGGGGQRWVGARNWGGGQRWGGWSGNRWGHRRGWGGGAVAAGLIGGLALGALASGPAYGYDYGYGYPVYGGYAPAYYDGYEAPVRCWWQRQRVPVDPWTVAIRRVRVCR